MADGGVDILPVRPELDTLASRLGVRAGDVLQRLAERLSACGGHGALRVGISKTRGEPPNSAQPSKLHRSRGRGRGLWMSAGGLVPARPRRFTGDGLCEGKTLGHPQLVGGPVRLRPPEDSRSPRARLVHSLASSGHWWQKDLCALRALAGESGKLERELYPRVQLAVHVRY